TINPIPAAPAATNQDFILVLPDAAACRLSTLSYTPCMMIAIVRWLENALQTISECYNHKIDRYRLVGKGPMAQFDVIIVGGGINGAGIARDAAMRGL